MAQQPINPPRRVAVVGAGPAGFYTAEALLRWLPGVEVDLYDRQAAPGGARAGAGSPDAGPAAQRFLRLPGLHFHGRLEVGRDLPLPLLLRAYHAVVLSHGAQAERRRPLPPGMPAALPAGDRPDHGPLCDFVAWYAQSPGAGTDTPPAPRHAVVIGDDAAALDLCGLLLQPERSPALAHLPAPVQQRLRRANIRCVHLVSPQGLQPAQRATAVQDRLQLLRDAGIALDLDGPRSDATADVQPAGRVRLHGGCPRRLLARPDGTAALVLQPADGQLYTLRCDLLLARVCRRVQPLAGVPLDPQTGNVRHRRGRVVDDQGCAVPGLYVAGWAKRGPGGLIGSNRACAAETVATMLADCAGWRVPDAADWAALLALRERAAYPPDGWSEWLVPDEPAPGPARRRLAIDSDVALSQTLAKAPATAGSSA